MRRRRLPFAIVLAVGLLTLLGGALLYRAKRPPVLTISAAQAAANARADTIHLKGSPDAPVTLEEFGDFQCPPCGKLAEPIAQLERDFRGRLRVIFRQLPLSESHENARDAALAAEAAGMQGRFWEMHALLYREQAVWSQAPEVRALFETYAATLGLDLARFKTDLASEAANARLAADEKRANELGVSTTPTIFLMDAAVPFREAMQPERLRVLVEEAVQKAKTAR